MSKLKEALYLTKHLRLCEQRAMDEMGLTEDELMMRAGVAALNTLKTHYPDVRAIAVFCGSGNNAGDGYVLAKLLFQQDFYVVVHQYKTVEDLPPTAKHAALAAMAAGVPFQYADDIIDSEVELVVDALLGIGLVGNVRGPIAHAINLINDSSLPVLSLDVPSGLDADTGRVLGVCVNADVTITFIALKVGLFMLDGPDHCGKVICHGLQLTNCMTTLHPVAFQLDQQLLQGLIAPRRKNSHKGMYGHVLVIGGGQGMPGAVCLAAMAAFKVGAGRVTVATLPEHITAILPLLPEAMIYPIEDSSALLPLLEDATIGVIGPGLGESEWANALFQAAIAAQIPLVIDASALHMLARNPQHDDNWVLTPHPGEAASLLACSTTDIQLDRCKSAHLIQQQYGGTVVLKGAGSIVKSGESETYICVAGNPGMATAGMGDVLSGVIGGLVAQGLSLADAAKLGVWLHAQAGDEAVLKQGERGLVASDLMPYLRRQINKCI